MQHCPCNQHGYLKAKKEAQSDLKMYPRMNTTKVRKFCIDIICSVYNFTTFVNIRKVKNKEYAHVLS